jgi:hypothetical protein
VIVGTALLSPLFLIMRGKDVSIPKGTSITAYIDGDRDISLPISGTDGANWTAPAEPLAFPAPRADPSIVVVKSDPEGAEIVVDGMFLGNTPSTVQLLPGDHLVSIQKSGYRLWQKGITMTSGGIVTINGLLERVREEELKANRQTSN